MTRTEALNRAIPDARGTKRARAWTPGGTFLAIRKANGAEAVFQRRARESNFRYLPPRMIERLCFLEWRPDQVGEERRPA